MDQQIISCPRCMKSVKVVLDNGVDKIHNQRCWHCEEQLS